MVVAAAATAVTVAVAATGDQKEYDDEKPDHVVVIKNIAETVHNILPSPTYGDFIKIKISERKSDLLSLSVIIL